MPDLTQTQKTEKPANLDLSDWQKPSQADTGIIEKPKEAEIPKEAQEALAQAEAPKNISEQSAPATPPPTPAVPAQPIIAVPKSPLRKDIEQTLSENINTFYTNMDAATKTAFKAKAVETAGKIEIMLASGKINVKKVIAWIREWLQMIPGVNKLFLEQESKIKADEIARLPNKHASPK